MSAKPWQSRLGTTLLPAIGRPLLRLYWTTLREGDVIGREHLERVLAADEPVILSYWHEMHFMGARFLARLNRRGLKVGALVSPSSDGELAARLGRPWLSEAIRASSSRTGAQGLKQLHEVVTGRRISPLITADGPRGPRREFKPGAILLAQATGAPILPLAWAGSRVWRLRSWDRFLVPKPFSRIVWAVGEPRRVGRDSTLKDLEPIQRELEATLATLIARAETSL